MAHTLNIGHQKRRAHVADVPLEALNPSDAISAGLRDGWRRTPDARYLQMSEVRKHYLNGYQCGFRERKAKAVISRYRSRKQRMDDLYIAMFEARYPHYIPPPMA